MNWKEFKQKYEETNSDSKILDFIAVEDYLLFSMEGLSNRDISCILDTDEEYVEEVLQEFLGFRGFKESLSFSPLKEYKSNFPFAEQVEKYLEIKKEVEEYYKEQ